LDERLVAHLINFRVAFENVMPFRTALTSVGFGCFYMAFHVEVENFTTLKDALPALRQPADAVRYFFDEGTRHQLAQGFNVDSLEITPG
jgi:hypothetical protein